MSLLEAWQRGKMQGQVENIERMMRENNDWRRAAEEAQEANRQLLAKFNELVKNYNEMVENMDMCLAERDCLGNIVKDHVDVLRMSLDEVRCKVARARQNAIQGK